MIIDERKERPMVSDLARERNYRLGMIGARRPDDPPIGIWMAPYGHDLPADVESPLDGKFDFAGEAIKMNVEETIGSTWLHIEWAELDHPCHPCVPQSPRYLLVAQFGVRRIAQAVDGVRTRITIPECRFDRETITLTRKMLTALIIHDADGVGARDEWHTA
jgi:hypothetical protein